MDFSHFNEDSTFKLFKGNYNYYRNNNIYTEEEFEVFQDKKEYAITFISSCHGRVATGELLSVKVHYTVNKDYIPIDVRIHKSLGENTAEETFSYNMRNNLLNYTFTDTEGLTTERELTTGPKFHIAIPSCAPSLLFIRSKKFDATSANIYIRWKSSNFWKFEEVPSTININLEKVSTGFENITANNQTLQATEYRLTESLPETDNQKDKKNDFKPSLKVYLSKHMAIPYLIKDSDGTMIEIQKLQVFDSL